MAIRGLWRITVALLFFSSSLIGAQVRASDPVQYRRAAVDGITVFYREAGEPSNPVILLLHGFPGSSYMFRDLIPLLSAQFHVIAPDYPGMGYSDAPPQAKFVPTFDSLADVIDGFTDQLHVTRYVLYMQDFGGPVGMRLALRHPDRIRGLVIQNTPVSLDGWAPERLQAIRSTSGPTTPEKWAAAEARVVEGTSIRLHQTGAAHPEALNPDIWANDEFALSDPEKKRIMTALILDIPSNLDRYPAWQDYLHTKKPPTLVVWGRNDPIFSPDGVETIRKLNPQAEVHTYDAGHFALDEQSDDIARRIIAFFTR